jgi:hypothetical protein
MIRKLAIYGTAALMAAAVLSCKESNRENSPVRLVVTTAQTLNRIDLKPGASGCNVSIGTVTVQAIIVQNSSGTLVTNPALDTVVINQYRVSYVRTDGGTQVPAPFTRSVSFTVTTGGTGVPTTFLGFQTDAINQAPFAALLPQNGGRDPQTGRSVVQMDLVLEVFGQTLAGEPVSGVTRVPLDFCYDCNGCA